MMPRFLAFSATCMVVLLVLAEAFAAARELRESRHLAQNLINQAVGGGGCQNAPVAQVNAAAPGSPNANLINQAVANCGQPSVGQINALAGTGGDANLINQAIGTGAVRCECRGGRWTWVEAPGAVGQINALAGDGDGGNGANLINQAVGGGGGSVGQINALAG